MLGFLKKHKNENVGKEFQAIKENVKEKQLPTLPTQPMASSENNISLAKNITKADVSTNTKQLSSVENIVQQPESDKKMNEMSKKPIEEAPQKKTNIEELFATNEENQSLEAEVKKENEEKEEITEEIEVASKFSPPLFISVQKYKEIVNELMSLKTSLLTLEQVISELKAARNKEIEVLESSIDELEAINGRIKYFADSFKIKG